jgi:isocitrate dehydrogenase (NAD+)
MLDHLGERAAAEKIDAALLKTYREGTHTTKDVGGKATSDQFANAVISALSAA